MLQSSLAAGTVHAPRFPSEGKTLIDGALELSLDEALGLEAAELTFQQSRVALTGDAWDRLEALAACAEALVEPASEGRQKRADRCDRAGWGFTDRLLMELAKQRAQP